MNTLFRILLAPLSLIYGIVVGIYQGLYLSGVLRSVRFNLPVISIGNLTVGGTGKSPHAEYLIRLLSDYFPVALISRGYLRKTRGHRELTLNSSVEEVGDEPLQIKLKFPELPVAVNENRAFGIPLLLKNHPEVQTIIMDDGFQHLQVRPGLNILLTEFNHLYSKDFLLPAGRLREWRYGASRADAIVVTKCPEKMDQKLKDEIAEELKLSPQQKLFFSRIKYGQPYNIFKQDEEFVLNHGIEVILISAIAQSEHLINYLNASAATVREFKYEDHHFFTEAELMQAIQEYKKISHYNKILLTTEKDAVRIRKFNSLLLENDVRIFAIPIEIEFFEKEHFDTFIKDYLLNFKA
ncbi:MAG: tetraacyldisaccharide 4'-kinase [Saprospiraceae bacterium]|nr:tetraacyldisaccharide 4'-kinase [Saprospiraceae bacterium]